MSDDNSETTCDEVDSNVNSELLLAAYVNQARWISQSIHPFINIRNALYAGTREVRDKNSRRDAETYSKEEIHTFNAIMKLERNFRAVVNDAAPKADQFALLVKKISEASCASRADDTSKLKKAILAYIHEDPTTGSTFSQESLASTDSKSLRGFHNIETARHLCPLKFKAAFEDDPCAIMDKIKSGLIILTAHDLPSFLYDRKVQYNECDEVTGLFRGFLLVRVYRHIFTGPSTVMNPTQNAPKSKARMFSLKEVTSRTIAYACVQAYIALSSMPKWGYSHNQFRLDTFYDNIVSVFEGNVDNPWVTGTLSWWNDQVPALQTVNTSKRIQMPQSDLGPSAANRITAQLRAGIGSNKFDEARISNQQELPSFLPSPLLSYSHRDVPRRSRSPHPMSGKKPECSHRTGRLTSTVNWCNPGDSDYDDVERHDAGVQVPISKKRTVGIIVVDEESRTKAKSRDMERRQRELCEKPCRQRKRRKKGDSTETTNLMDPE